MYIERRPWGEFQVLTEGPGFKVKRIIVDRGGQLSLQSHKRRSEHWTIARGLATVTVNDAVLKLKPGQSIDIPLGARHRLESLDDEVVDVIEVQFGDYLEEDDIIRYSDVYDRA